MSLLVSAKLEIDERAWQVDGKFAEQSVIDGINAHLPDAIRVFGARRVVGSFSARFNTTERTYTYYLPYDAFDGKLAVASLFCARRRLDLLGCLADARLPDCRCRGRRTLHEALSRLELLSQLHSPTTSCVRVCVRARARRRRRQLTNAREQIPVSTRDQALTKELIANLSTSETLISKWMPLFTVCLRAFSSSFAALCVALPTARFGVSQQRVPSIPMHYPEDFPKALEQLRTLMHELSRSKRRDDVVAATRVTTPDEDKKLIAALTLAYSGDDEPLLVRRLRLRSLADVARRDAAGQARARDAATVARQVAVPPGAPSALRAGAVRRHQAVCRPRLGHQLCLSSDSSHDR